MTMKKTSVAVIAVLSALTVGTGVLAMMSAQATVPKRLPTADHVESGVSVPESEPKASLPENEQKAIDTQRDELVDVYQSAFNEAKQQQGDKISDEEFGWVYRGKCETAALNTLIRTVTEKALPILEKYGAISQNTSVDDFYTNCEEIVDKACGVVNDSSLTLEEQVTLKFFIKQTYNEVSENDSFKESVEKRVDFTYVPYIDSTTVHSYEIEELPEISEEESSR